MSDSNVSSDIELAEHFPPDQQEDESDLGVGHIEFKDAVVMNSDWTIETLNGQVAKGNIELDPAFQRRAAWDGTRKSRLIESIIVGMPIPNLVLAENKRSRGKFIVIDGKQRLLSLRDFAHEQLVLEGLDIRSDLNGRSYSTLPSEDREYFDNSTIRSTVIKNWSDEKFLYATFYRLNSGSLPLSPQELRRALVGGRFLEALDTYILGSENFKSVIALKPDRRMRDSELVLRFVAFDRSLIEYAGNLRDFLDTATRYFETDWPEKEGEAVAHLKRLDRALRVANSVFHAQSFRKWTGQKYERAINRAVFDCLARFFAEPSIETAIAGNEDKIKAAFEDLCVVPAFKDAIERTTKSIEATTNRINLWGKALADCLDKVYDPTSKRIS